MTYPHGMHQTDCRKKTERTKVMKKVLSLILCFAMLCAVLVGCAQTEETTSTATDAEDASTSATEDPVTIVWQSWDSYSKYEAAILAFEEKYSNINVEYEQVSDYLTKIMTEATSGELPDLISCKSGYTPIFADAGILAEIDVETLKSESAYNYNDFWETTYDYCTFDGINYALPIDGGGYAWVYNEKMFDQLGIEVPEEGFTWSEFDEVCAKLKENKDALGISYPTLINDYGYRTLYPWAMQNGAEYLNEDRTACLFNSEANLEAFSYLQDLVEKGYMPPMEKLDEGSYPIVGMINSGEIAMGRIALWETTALEDSDTVTWQVMHSPRADDGTQAEILYINTIAIAADSEQKDAAMTFIKYITGEEGLSILLEGTSDPQTSVRKALQDLSISMFPEEKHMYIYNDAISYSTWIPNMVTYEDQLMFIEQQLDRIWYGGEDPAPVFADIEAGINGMLQDE